MNVRFTRARNSDNDDAINNSYPLEDDELDELELLDDDDDELLLEDELDELDDELDFEELELDELLLEELE